MRKSFLSLATIVILIVFSNTKAVDSVGETKKTKYDFPLLTYSFEPDRFKSTANTTQAELTEPVEIEPEVVVKAESKTFEVTAYTAGYESTQKKKGHPLYGITANGERAKEGTTVACPRSMDFGTKLYIEELDHTFICQDRGGAIKEGHLDIYFDDLKEAKNFGRQKMNVQVMKED